MPVNDPLGLGLPMVSLNPGSLFVALEPTLLITILGSCVAVSLYCPRLMIGAMCHGVMPVEKGGEKGCFHFVDCSITHMVEALTAEGAGLRELEVKMFGGARLFGGKGSQASAGSGVGVENIEAARSVLRDYGLPVQVERVGGSHGCKVFFYSHTGEVFLRSIARLKNRGNTR